MSRKNSLYFIYYNAQVPQQSPYNKYNVMFQEQYFFYSSLTETKA